MKIDWFSQVQYEDAMAASKAQGKPILIYFHSTSCGGCARLVKEVLADERVANAITRSVIPVWVEVEQERADSRVSQLVGSHVFIMSPVVQLISSDGDIFHKFLGTPLHTRLDLGYTRVHHDVAGTIDAEEFLAQLAVGLGKRELGNGNYPQAIQTLEPLVAVGADELAAGEAAYWLPIARNAGRYPEDARAQRSLPALSVVANEVRRYCSLLCSIPDSELMLDWPGQPGTGGWAHYTDCLREVSLGVLQSLLDVANRITHVRQATHRPLTQTQLSLKEWQCAYRTLQGTLHGLKAEDWDRQHLHRNYSLGKQRTIRNNIVHCVMAEFWAHGSAIRGARLAYAGDAGDGLPPVLATWRRHGPPPAGFGDVAELFSLWEQRHEELLEELSSIGDEELDFERSWWEGSDVSIRFRVNRLGWHLQDHAAVVETICERLSRVRSETERLALRIYSALGCAEGAAIGLPVLERRALFAEVASLLRGKSDELQALYRLDDHAPPAPNSAHESVAAGG
jgi:Thioredoxin-like/DinB superfamily